MDLRSQKSFYFILSFYFSSFETADWLVVRALKLDCPTRTRKPQHPIPKQELTKSLISNTNTTNKVNLRLAIRAEHAWYFRSLALTNGFDIWLGEMAAKSFTGPGPENQVDRIGEKYHKKKRHRNARKPNNKIFVHDVLCNSLVRGSGFAIYFWMFSFNFY